MKMHSGFEFSCPGFEEILVNDSYNPYTYAPYPKLDVLANFSSAVYTDYAVNEDHEKYEKKLNLPGGWKLLTAAFKGKISYKYFGIALWNSQLQEVVLVHRGTKIRRDWLTNITGVSLNTYTSHMECAMSFAERIKSAIQRANKSDKCFRLSITGHSLGGWFAQITGFSVKYLHVKDNKFTEISDLNDGLHAHVVVFDSPGCRDMLEKIQSKYMLRYNKTMYIRNIDITIYFCVPNLVNAIGLHAGSLYQIMSKLPDFELSYKHITEITHAIKYFIDALKECPGSRKIEDWPIFNVMTTELKIAYKMLSLGFIQEPRPEQWKKCRLKLEEFDGTASASLSTFSENEFRILDCWNTLKKGVPNKRFIFITDILGDVFYEDFLIDRYDKYTITCQSKESLETVIHYTQLLARRHYPRFTEIMGKFFVANNEYLANLPYCCVEFDTIAIQEFLESPKHILHIKIDSSKKCRKLEMTRLYSILCQLRNLSNLDKYLDYGKQTFMELELLETIQDPDSDGADFTQDNLLVVDCVKNLDQDSNYCELKRILKKLKIFNKMKKNCDKKIILVTSHDLTKFFNTLKISFCETNENVGLTHLAESSKGGVVQNKILVGGESLAAYAGTGTTEIIHHIDSSVHKREVKRLMTDTKFILKIDNPAPECAEPYVASTHDTEMTVQEVERVLERSPGALLLISTHSHSEESRYRRWNKLNRIAKRFKITLKTVESEREELLEKILQENTHEMVYLFQISVDKIVFKKMFKHCYIDRNFHHQMVFDFKKTENCTHDTFEVQGAQDEELSFFSKNIPTAASDEHVQNVNINAGKHIVKFEGTIRRCVLQRSEGSLKGIRPYITNYTDKPIEEKTFWENLQKTVIIADEHDTGKSTSLRRAPRFLQSSWVIYPNIKEFRTSTDLSSITEFLLPENGSTDKLRRKVLEFCLDNNNKSSRRVYLLFDDVNDVNEEDDILTLLKFLKYESAAHVCVTTQIYQKKILEDELSVFATSFERSKKSQQKDYLTDCLRWGVFSIPESVKRKLDECVMIFHSEAENMLGSNIHTFLGNPRRIQHLGSILMERISYFDWWKRPGNFSETNVVFELYQKSTSLDKYFVQANLRENVKNIFMENLSETFRKLALSQLFSGKDILKTDIDKNWNSEAVRTGQVESGGDKFIHPTLAVYHLADLIVKFLNGNIAYLHPKPLVQLILFEILPSDSCKLARLFINHFLITDPPRLEALRHISDEIVLWDEENHKKAFDKATRENNEHILKCLEMLCQIKLATKAGDINGHVVRGSIARN